MVLVVWGASSSTLVRRVLDLITSSGFGKKKTLMFVSSKKNTFSDVFPSDCTCEQFGNRCQLANTDVRLSTV